MNAMRSTKGFTMMELLVVIGIIMILTAIMVPVGQRLRENNRTSQCQVQLSRIGQALRVYYMDEGGVPPVGVVDADNNGQPDDTNVDTTLWPQLGVLWRLDYLPTRATLHCPRHFTTAAGAALTSSSPEYYQSYMGQDTAAKPSASLNQYRYMPYRWATAATYPVDYRRQLCQAAASANVAGVNNLVCGASSAMPADDTLVTWCDRHAASYNIAGHGQYIGLYFDGSVQLLDAELFRDPAVSPAEAWLVKPADIAP